MNNYAKAVLWIGLFLIIAQLVKNWSTLSQTIFGVQVPAGAKLPGPGGLPALKGPHPCPAGYTFAFGRCWSPAVNPQPPPVGIV